MRTLTLALALALTPSAQAAEALTLEQALREALGRNPALATSELAVDQAAGSVTSAQAVFDPQLQVNGNLSSEESNQLFGGFVFDQSNLRATASSAIRGDLMTGTGYSLTGRYTQLTQEGPDFRTGQTVETERATPSVEASLSQELLRGHRSAFNRRRVIEARNSLDVAELQLEAQRQRTLADVASAYWTWAHNVRLVEIALERQQVADEALRIGRARLQEGRAAPVEVTRLQTESVRAAKAVVDAEQAVSEAADALLLQLGRMPGEDVTPATPMEVPVDLEIDVQAAIQAALEGNLELRVDALEADQAVLSHKLARHGTLPSLTISGNASFTQVRNKVDGVAEDPLPNQTIGAGATFSMPLGNRAARGEVQRAAATETQRQLDLEQRRRQVASDVARQVRVLNAAAEQVRLTDLEVELAEQTLQAEEARQRAGRNVARDVLDARAALFDAKARAARARVDHQLAAVGLLRLQGALDLDAASP